MSEVLETPNIYALPTGVEVLRLFTLDERLHALLLDPERGIYTMDLSELLRDRDAAH